MATAGKPDWALFSIQVANAGFFVHNALTAGLTSNGQRIIPTALAMVVVGVAIGATAAHALASGVIGAADAGKR